MEQKKEYYRQMIIDTIMSIDSIDILIYLHEFINAKFKAE